MAFQDTDDERRDRGDERQQVLVLRLQKRHRAFGDLVRDRDLRALTGRRLVDAHHENANHHQRRDAAQERHARDDERRDFSIREHSHLATIEVLSSPRFRVHATVRGLVDDCAIRAVVRSEIRRASPRVDNCGARARATHPAIAIAAASCHPIARAAFFPRSLDKNTSLVLFHSQYVGVIFSLWIYGDVANLPT